MELIDHADWSDGVTTSTSRCFCSSSPSFSAAMPCLLVRWSSYDTNMVWARAVLCVTSVA